MGFPGDVLGNVKHCLVKVADTNPVFPMCEIDLTSMVKKRSRNTDAAILVSELGIGRLMKSAHSTEHSVIFSRVGHEPYLERRNFSGRTYRTEIVRNVVLK